ncbi:MAG TPA: hypothetical protein VHA73_13515 [Acidimicrobiales bacterium]|nr:hypothetical protein [Acidimicrobiales bacterium]
MARAAMARAAGSGLPATVRAGGGGRGAGGRGDGPVARGVLDWWFVVAVAVAITPILVAGLRAATSGWYPTGDDGIVGLRAQDVFTNRPPLLGTWSSASMWSHQWLNHPGPALFVSLAVPVAVLGVGAGVAVGMALVNAASVVLAACLARRRAGPLGAILALVAMSAMSLTFGSVLLYDPWNPNAAMLPFVLFLFGVWSVADGDLGVLWVAVVAGSFTLQTHLSYVLLVPGLLAAALVVALVDHGFDRRAGRRRRWLSRRDRRGLLVGLAALLVCWSAPLYEQLTASKGNFTRLWQASSVKPPQTPGLPGAVDALGSVVARPPFWLLGSWDHPRFSLHPTASDAVVPGLLLALVVVVTVGLAVLAWKRGDRTRASLGMVVVVALALGLLSATRSTSPFGLVPAYVQWMWPIAMFSWFALVLSAAGAVTDRRADRGQVHNPAHAGDAGGDERALGDRSAEPVARPTSGADPRRSSPGRSLPALIALGLVMVLAVIAGANLPRVDRGSGGSMWAIGATKSLFAQAAPALRNHAVLVDDPGRPPALPSKALFAVAPALLSMLQSHGIDFVVPTFGHDQSMVRQVGDHRRWNGSNADIELSILSGPDVDAGAVRGRIIAHHDGLSADQRAQRQTLRRRLVAEVRSRGGLHLSAIGRDEVRTGRVTAELARAVEQSRADPAGLFAQRRFATLVELDALDLGDLAGADARRYVALTADLYDHTVTLVVQSLAR